VLLGLLVSVIFLYLLFSHLALEEALARLRSVDAGLLVPATIVYFLGLVPRSFRWQALLSPIKMVGLRRCFAYVMIGLMANELLPARGGELVRAVLLGRREQISSAAVLTTILVERVFDVLSLMVFLGLLLATLELPDLLRGGGMLATIASVTALVSLWLAASYRERIARWALLVASLLPRWLAGPLLTQLDGVLAGLAVMREPRQLLSVTFHSIVSWAALIAGAHLFLQATGLWLPWQAPVMVMVSSGLGMILPSSPGAIGVFHWFAAKALEVPPWQVPWSTAVAFAFVLHSASYLVNLLVGALFLAAEGLSWRDMTRTAAPEADEPETIKR